MIASFYWDAPKELLPFALPFLGRSILWYGFLFSLGFFLAYLFVVYLFQTFFSKQSEFSVFTQIDKRAQKSFLEPLCFSVFLGALIGARLGDVFFYQNIQVVLKNPLSIFAFWEGGLASHGGVIGIFVALYLFAKKKNVSFVRLLDISCLPACLAAGFIRIGNFFNQEILGKVTDLPWAVCFGHPVDGMRGVFRHPVQIYESIGYFSLFLVLWYFGKKFHFFNKKGVVSGLFFASLFSLRFFFEFFKEEQSAYFLGTSGLTMGQYLSLPFILFGLFLLKKNNPFAVAQIDRHHR